MGREGEPNFTVAQRDGQVTVSPVGELDVFNAEPLRQELMRQLKEGGPRLAVDMAGVISIDATAIGIFYALHRKNQAFPTEISLVNVDSPHVQKAFESVQLSRMFDYRSSNGNEKSV